MNISRPKPQSRSETYVVCTDLKKEAPRGFPDPRMPNDTTKKALKRSMPWHTPGAKHKPATHPSEQPQVTAREPVRRPNPAGAGRPTTVCIENAHAIAELLHMGVAWKIALARAGVPRRTVDQVMRRFDRGECKDEEEREFCQILIDARTDIMAARVRNVENHSAEDWKASAWLLERTEPDSFGSKQRIELSQAKDLDDEGLVEQLVDAVLALPSDSPQKQRLYLELQAELGEVSE